MRLYKQLHVAERAYRTMNGALEVRPIRYHLETRVRVHFFLFMLAYYVLFDLGERLQSMLFSDDCPPGSCRSSCSRCALPRSPNQGEKRKDR